MRTILILLDTVIKDQLSIYNKDINTKTPNIEELANDACIFENHYTGSLPCMPARRDLLTGRMDFLERFWGPIEPFDTLMTRELSKNGISTHISTDHHHYFRYGGEGYVQSYDTYDFFRGQESDPWISQVDGYVSPNKTHGRYNKQFEFNKMEFKEIDQYPTIKTFDAGIDFIKRNKQKEDFFLQIEGFDPHEPFHCPKEFLELYGINDDDLGYLYNSPKYGVNNDTKEELEYIRKRYQANLSFADYGLGKLINCLKELNIYDDTQIIFTTDHGFNLGEHDYMGKGLGHIYNSISSIPLLIKNKNQKDSKKIEAITQNIDIMPTILEENNIEIKNKIHGKSLIPLMKSKVNKIRDCAISGYFSQSIMLTDGKYTLYKGVKSDEPIYVYTAMPVTMKGYFLSDEAMFDVKEEDIEVGKFLKHTNHPVFKIPFFDDKKKNPMHLNISDDEIYLNTDTKQINKIEDNKIKEDMINKLKLKFNEYDVLEEQFKRYDI